MITTMAVRVSMGDIAIIFMVLFGLLIISLIFMLAAMAYRKKKDDAEPIVKVEAKVLENNLTTGLGGAVLASTVLFACKGGNRVRLAIDGDPGLIVGDKGILVYRGKRFIKFEKSMDSY